MATKKDTASARSRKKKLTDLEIEALRSKKLKELVELGVTIEEIKASPAAVMFAGLTLHRAAANMAVAPFDGVGVERVRSLESSGRDNDPFIVLVKSVGDALISWANANSAGHDKAIELARAAISKIPHS